ncbi:hypothetical protein ACFLT7_01925 [candidate division KSB1 bacterium]
MSRERIFAGRRLAWFIGFAAAMALVEAAVVVYLRELYYPDGFGFPLVAIPTALYLTELAREAATIIMLAALAVLTVRRPLARFLVFSFCFAVWDIGYYFWLKLLLGWPGSLLEPDILFLIPLPWIAPVLAPIVVSVCLIAAALIPDRLFAELKPPGAAAWTAAVAGGVLVIGSFLAGTSTLIQQTTPENYPWWLFIAGILSAAVGFFLWINKLKSGQG